MTTNRWTKKELNTLTRMRAEGATYKAIAEKLGRTPASVQQKAHKLKLGVRFVPETKPKATAKPKTTPKPEVQLELPLDEPKTQFVEMEYDLDKLEWVEKEPVDQLARAVDLYVPLAGGVMAGVLIGASLAMWML